MANDRQRTHGGIHECLESLVLSNPLSVLSKLFKALGNHLHNLRPTEVPECLGQITDDLNEREQRSKEGINCRVDSPRQEGHKVLPPRTTKEFGSHVCGIAKCQGTGNDKRLKCPESYPTGIEPVSECNTRDALCILLQLTEFFIKCLKSVASLSETRRELIDFSLSGSNRSTDLLERRDGDESERTGTQTGNDKRTGKSTHNSHCRRKSRGNDRESGNDKCSHPGEAATTTIESITGISPKGTCVGPQVYRLVVQGGE